MKNVDRYPNLTRIRKLLDSRRHYRMSLKCWPTHKDAAGWRTELAALEEKLDGVESLLSQFRALADQ